jgi:endoglucanase
MGQERSGVLFFQDRRVAERRRAAAGPRDGVERRRAERRRNTALAGAFVVAAALGSTAAAAERPDAGASNPFAGAKWFVDPDSHAAQQAAEWLVSRPKDARQMQKIASHAQADWFGDWSGDVQAKVDARVTQIAAVGALPVLVAYNIPDRDCSGGQSGGGAGSAEEYRDWIRRFSLGIAGRRAVVILEPDALADLGNCDPATQQERLGLIWDAVNVLKGDALVGVYIDAGHSHWMPVATAADRLNGAGVDIADGFSLNVSNFYASAGEIAYGKAVSALVGGKHFVVDTSRNGAGSEPPTWCNPPGMALGSWPSASTRDPQVDAFVWVKRPGESDGQCGGGPPAGQWWADYALGLAQGAH